MQLDRTSIKTGAAVPLVAIISNPLSTSNNGGMDGIRRIIGESANVVHFELDGMETVDEALALFARANPSLLIVNGGDGTIGAVLAAILNRNPFHIVPPIALLPGGKTNMTAADLGFRGKPEKVLKRLLDIAERGSFAKRLATRHLVELDLGDGSAPRVGTFFGTAGVVKGIHWCRQNAYSLGLPNCVAHAIAVGKLLLSAFGIGRPLMISDPMTVTVLGGGRFSGQFSAVISTTLDRLILGIRPYGREGNGGLRFSAVEAGGTNLMRALSGLVTGRYGEKSIEGVHVRRANEIRIEGTDPVTLDGEIYHPKPGRPLTLRGDRQLTFVSLK